MADRDQYISLRVTAKELYDIDQAVKKMGTDRATFCRACSLKCASLIKDLKGDK